MAIGNELLSPLLLQEGWELRQHPFLLVKLELDVDEGELSPLLRAHQSEHTTIQVGSYPRFEPRTADPALVRIDAPSWD